MSASPAQPEQTKLLIVFKKLVLGIDTANKFFLWKKTDLTLVLDLKRRELKIDIEHSFFKIRG